MILHSLPKILKPVLQAIKKICTLNAMLCTKSDPLTSGFEIKRPKFVEMRNFAASHPDYIPEASGKHALCGAILANNINGVWMAETQGFEPWEDFHPRRFSRPVHSTTLPSLRRAHL